MKIITQNGNVSLDPWRGGCGEIYASGNFGGGTLSLQRQEPGDATWITIGSGSTFAQLTANGTLGFSACACNLQLNLANATNANISFGMGRVMRPSTAASDA